MPLLPDPLQEWPVGPELLRGLLEGPGKGLQPEVGADEAADGRVGVDALQAGGGWREKSEDGRIIRVSPQNICSNRVAFMQIVFPRMFPN